MQLWQICQVEVLHDATSEDFVALTFGAGVTSALVRKSIRVLTQRACVHVPSNSHAVQVRTENGIDRCQLVITYESLHALRLTGFVEHFRVVKKLRRGVVTKTVPLHPLLLRLYATRPTFRPVRDAHIKQNTSSFFFNYDPVQLYNFVSITLSWCNHVHAFVEAPGATLHDLILAPDSMHFYIYNHLHRLVDLFYDEGSDFVDAVWQNSLVKVVGRFLGLRCVRYISAELYQRLREFVTKLYVTGTVPDFIVAHKYVVLHLFTGAADFLTEVAERQSVDLWALHRRLHHCAVAHVPYVDTMQFISRLYGMLLDERFGDRALARLCLCALENATRSRHTEVLVDGTFSGKYEYSVCMSGAEQFEKYMRVVDARKERCEYRMHEQREGVLRSTERLYPLEMLLSMLDQLVMRTKKVSVSTLTVKLCDYSSACFQRMHDAPMSIDCWNPVFQDNLDLPVRVQKPPGAKRRQCGAPEFESVCLQQSFFLLHV